MASKLIVSEAIMKKTLCLISALSLAPVFAAGKFINSSTFEVKVKARGAKGAKGMRGQVSCFQAAQLMGQGQMIEALANKGWPNVKGKVSKKKYKNMVQKEFSGVISGALVKSKKYNKKKNTCVMRMRIKKSGLKTRLRSLVMAETPKGRFISDSIFEVQSSAKGNPKLKGIRRQISCTEAARVGGNQKIIEALAEAGWPNVKGKISRKEYKNKLTKELQGTISGASVQAKEYNKATNRCKVTLRIKRDKLKEKLREIR